MIKSYLMMEANAVGKTIAEVDRAYMFVFAQLADTLSKFNVRSKNRRQNFATMIKASVSSND